MVSVSGSLKTVEASPIGYLMLGEVRTGFLDIPLELHVSV